MPEAYPALPLHPLPNREYGPLKQSPEPSSPAHIHSPARYFLIWVGLPKVQVMLPPKDCSSALVES